MRLLCRCNSPHLIQAQLISVAAIGLKGQADLTSIIFPSRELV